MASGNPMLSDDALRRMPTSRLSAGVMTIDGTTNKAMLLAAVLVIAAGFTWHQTIHGGSPTALAGLGAIVGLVLALVTAFKPLVARYTAVPYAVAQGLLLGGFSAMLEMRYPGLIIQAVALTMGTLFAMLVGYRTRLIKVTDRMRSMIASATMGILLFYLAGFVLRLFHVSLPWAAAGSTLGIGISLVVCGVAAFNLVLDFDFIENGSRRGLPQAFEWYGAFGLLVTLVWLYIEMVRLLSRLRER
jgi:uncharacterized YccA/Bax inhibitor family protein